jgi:hypothetical protein
VTLLFGAVRITWATLLAATSITFSMFYFTAYVTNMAHAARDGNFSGN